MTESQCQASAHRVRRRAAVVLAAALLLGFARPVSADTGAQKRARAHAKQGDAYFDAKEYERAIAEYQAAFDLDGKPSRIFNIAVCHDYAGHRAKAIETYQRYVALEPEGRAADSARAAIAKLTHDQEVEDQRRREAEEAEARRRAEEADTQKQEQDRLAAEGHVKQAQAYADAGSYEQAGDEYVAAYGTQPDPAHLWAAAEAYRQAGGGAKEVAVELYRRYLAAAPGGEHADLARRQIAILTRPANVDARRAAAQAEPASPKPYVRPTIIDERPPPRPAPKWLWPAAAAVALGAGLYTDLAPASARNDTIDATDFIPVGLYALSAVFVGVWVF